MNMIEKVARVIWKEMKGYDPTNDQLNDSVAGKAILKIAKAAIAAMREPTEEMIKAGIKSLHEQNRLNSNEDMACSYRLMIDAARATDPRCKRPIKYKFQGKCYCRQHMGLVILHEMLKVGKVKEL